MPDQDDMTEADRIRVEELVRQGYQLLAVRRDASSTNRQQQEQECERTFREFESLRGRVIGQATTIETQVSAVIAEYLCPTVDPDRIELSGPRVYRQWELMDLVLMRESCTFAQKSDALRRIIREAEVSPEGFRDSEQLASEVKKALLGVMTWRNQFAHRPVGIHWSTLRVWLWSSTGRNWEELSNSVEQEFSTVRQDSARLLEKVGGEIRNLQRTGNPKDSRTIGF